MNTQRGELFIVGLIAVVALVGMIVLVALGHGVEAGEVVTAAMLLGGLIRNNQKLADVHSTAQAVKDDTAALLNGELVDKIKQGFVEAMTEQGYAYTDPEAPATSSPTTNTAGSRGSPPVTPTA